MQFSSKDYAIEKNTESLFLNSDWFKGLKCYCDCKRRQFVCNTNLHYLYEKNNIGNISTIFCLFYTRGPNLNAVTDCYTLRHLFSQLELKWVKERNICHLFRFIWDHRFAFSKSKMKIPIEGFLEEKQQRFEFYRQWTQNYPLPFT